MTTRISKLMRKLGVGLAVALLATAFLFTAPTHAQGQNIRQSASQSARATNYNTTLAVNAVPQTNAGFQHGSFGVLQNQLGANLSSNRQNTVGVAASLQSQRSSQSARNACGGRNSC